MDGGARHDTGDTSDGRGDGRAHIAPPVLIVDDDADLREILRAVLEEDGYAVATAEGGAEALALLRASEMAMIVLLDHYLSGPAGRAVLAALCGDAGSGAPSRHAIIYMSAGAAGEDAELRAELESMRVPYLPKPFDLDEMLALVAAAAARLTSVAGRGGVPSRGRGSYGSVA